MRKLLPSPRWFAWAAALLSAGMAAACSAATTFQVIAERSDEALRATSNRTYALIDGGRIHEGQVLAGDPPPDPLALSAIIRSELGQAGFSPAAPGHTPALLIVYHWGALLDDQAHIAVEGPSYPPAPATHTLVARMRLLNPGAESEAYFGLANDNPRTNGRPAAEPTPAVRKLMRAASEDERYFVVLAVYDHHLVVAQRPELLARTKASCVARAARQDSAVMLASVAAVRALGQNHDARDVTVSREIPTTHATADLLATDLDGLGAPRETLIELLKSERNEIRGVRPLLKAQPLAAVTHRDR